MSTVGQIEKKTQARVVKLFRKQLNYDYLGDWSEREGNRNIEEDLLRKFLSNKQGYEEALISRALFDLEKAAGNASHSLYDRNKEVYSLLRYGVPVKASASIIRSGSMPLWLYCRLAATSQPCH